MEVELKVDDNGNYGLAITELRKHPTFVITTLAVRTLTSGIIPIILLIFFYAKVICFDLFCCPAHSIPVGYKQANELSGLLAWILLSRYKACAKV